MIQVVWRWLAAWALMASVAAAQEDEPPRQVAPREGTAAKAAPPVVAARVQGKPIYVAEVADELESALKGRAIDADARPRLLAEMLAHIVERRLVLEHLRLRMQAADPKQVDAQITLMTDQLKQQGTTLPAFLAARGITEAALREQIAWRLSWKSYVERHVNDALLERHFNAHRRDFDGTQVHAAQILLPLPKNADAAAVESVRKQAEDLRKQIEGGQLTFEAAAAIHSVAASKQRRGDLGLINRRGSLPEPVAAAAFALDAGKMGEPVVTPFGVHLVRVVEVKPGTKTWRDVAAELQSAVVRRGFAKIAAAQRGKANVEFTGAIAYFDPKSGKLVAAKP
jgi:parvulin-like peptidyl-prolyl isomerase